MFLNLNDFLIYYLIADVFLCMVNLLLFVGVRLYGFGNVEGFRLNGFGSMAFIILGLLQRDITFLYYFDAYGLRRRIFIVELGLGNSLLLVINYLFLDFH